MTPLQLNDSRPDVLAKAVGRMAEYQRLNGSLYNDDGQLLPLTQFYCNATNADCTKDQGADVQGEYFCSNHTPADVEDRVTDATGQFWKGREVTTGTGLSGFVEYIDGHDIGVMVNYANGAVTPYLREFDADSLTPLDDE